MKYFLSILCLLALLSGALAQKTPLSLSKALSYARAGRARVEAAQLKIAGARQSRRALGAFPATQLLIGHSNRAEVGGLDDDLVLVQPIDAFGRTSANRAIGDAEVERAEAELQQVLAGLQNDVIKQYSEAAAAKALSDSAAELQLLAQRLHDAIKVLVEEGKLPGVQLARVAIELERAMLTATKRSADLKASLQRLGGLLNIPNEPLAVEEFAQIKVELVELASLSAEHADLRLLAADIKAAQAEARVAGLSNWPELEIHGRQTSWHDADRQFGVRIQVVIPLNDFGRARSEAAAARLRVGAARKALADAVRLAESELQASGTELASAQAQVERYSGIVTATRTLVEKSRIGFTERAVTLVELLESARALREVEVGFVEARLRLAFAQAAYLRASGKLLEVSK